ncbi:phosphopantetheine-binding protein [Nocardia sp. NPDC051570]|uniref:phosphopantetheine-binding protein n=1 Tax=Nocardia sp. NPDC051570 TaxID=3364324 RepID=UPI0037A30183
MWDLQFEQILRKYLPFLSPDESLTSELELRDLGLDSLATVELLSELEQAYDTRFVDDALALENFATPAVLWTTLSSLSAGVAG